MLTEPGYPSNQSCFNACHVAYLAYTLRQIWRTSPRKFPVETQVPKVSLSDLNKLRTRESWEKDGAVSG
jgi:hypothetical protein